MPMGHCRYFPHHYGEYRIIIQERIIYEGYVRNDIVFVINAEPRGGFRVYWSYSIGFFIASLVQAAVVLVSEKIGLSSLGVTMSTMQLLVHFFVGQIAGYLFLYLWRNSNTVKNLNMWFTGLLIGLIFWTVNIPIASYFEKLNWPPSIGLTTTLVTLTAFLFFGFICSYTIISLGRLSDSI